MSYVVNRMWSIVIPLIFAHPPLGNKQFLILDF
jgi:hypothetical protein